MFTLSVCVFFAFLWQAESAQRSLPPYIKACSVSDPKIGQCIKDHGNEAIIHLKDGDRKFRIPMIRPLRINEAIISPGANLKLGMKDVDVYGLDTIRIVDADFVKEPEKNIVKMIMTLPQIQLIGQYEIDGRILILPIVGHGRSNITCDNMFISYDLHMRREKRNGFDQVKILDTKVDYNTTRVYYQFDNLFNGEPRLGAEMKKFLDENWSEIHDELHGSFNEIIASIIMSFMANVVDNLPYDNIWNP